MRVIMPRIQRDWVDQIIITDGGSTDGTIEYARENGYFVHVQERKGFRYCYTEILDIIEGDVVVTFSPDGNSIPELIPELVAKMKEGYDLVIVSRYKDDAVSDDDDPITAFGNWLFTRTVKLLYGGGLTDVMVIFRAFRKQTIYDLDLHRDEAYRTPERLFGCTLSWEPLQSVRAIKMKLKIAEIPGDEPARIGGKRKLQILRWGFGYYYQFWRELFFWHGPSE